MILSSLPSTTACRGHKHVRMDAVIIAKVAKWEKEAKFFAENNAFYSEILRKFELERLRRSSPSQEEFEISAKAEQDVN